MNEFDALDAWRDGAAQAGEQLVRSYYPRVYRFFYGKLDTDICQDLTQQTLEALCSTRNRFRRGSGLSTFVFGIARNKLLMHLRGERRRHAAFDPLTDTCPVPRQDQSLTSLFDARSQELLVARSLARLPADDQILLELSDYEGLTRSQLAEIFETAPGTIASRIRRARSRVRALIEELTEDKDLAAASLHGLESCMRSIRGHMDTTLRNRVSAATER